MNEVDDDTVLSDGLYATRCKIEWKTVAEHCGVPSATSRRGWMQSSAVRAGIATWRPDVRCGLP